MEELLYYLISTLVTVVLFAVILFTRRGLSFFKLKADAIFDQNRNAKVATLVTLVTDNVDKAIAAFFVENEIEEITEENLPDVVRKIADKVNTLTGDGVVKYLMDTFVDNWDDWVYEFILARITKEA